MPIFLPDYSKGLRGGLDSMISQMADQFAAAQEEIENEEEGVVLSAAAKRSALRDISPHMIRQIGYYECLRMFNRNLVRGGYQGMPSDGPQTTNLLVGLELLTALLEHDDWTLEFVLAASEEDERDAWDNVIKASINLRESSLDPLSRRYTKLFSNIPANWLSRDGYIQDKIQLKSIMEALAIIVRLKATFTIGPCDVCQKEANSRCSRCKQVFFCGKPHQTQAWKTHKLVCKATPTAQPPSDTEKSSLVDLGCAKIPSDMSETQGCVRYLQNQQGDVLKRLINHTRNKNMIVYLHQLHLGTLTQPEEPIVD